MVTPGVVVEPKEVSSLIVGATIHVVRKLEAIVIDISTGISNRDFTIIAGSNVLLHITGNSLDIRGTRAGVDTVDVFVSGEEKKSIVVLLELINRSEYILKVEMVVRWSWFISSDGVMW